MRHAFHNIYKGAAELVIPVRSTSAFQEKGVRTQQNPSQSQHWDGSCKIFPTEFLRGDGANYGEN